MKYFLIFFTSFLLFSCTNNKTVFWCGDHQCINKKEKEAYFKKTLIVEKRNIKEMNQKKTPSSKKILEQAKLKEKERIANEKELEKIAKIEKKNKLKEEKELAKKLKKQKKELKKKNKLEKKRLKKEEQKIAKKMKSRENTVIDENQKSNTIKIITSQNKTNQTLNIFDDLKDKILSRNISKSYPDINDIPW